MAVASPTVDPAIALKTKLQSRRAEAEREYQSFVRDPAKAIDSLDRMEKILLLTERTPDDLQGDIQHAKRRVALCKAAAEIDHVISDLEGLQQDLAYAQKELADVTEPIATRIKALENDRDRASGRLARVRKLRAQVIAESPAWLRDEINRVSREIAIRRRRIEQSPMPTNEEAVFEDGEWRPTQTSGVGAAETQKEFEKFMARVNEHRELTATCEREIEQLAGSRAALENLAASSFPTVEEMATIIKPE